MISVTHFAFENIAISKVHAAQVGGDQDGEGQEDSIEAKQKDAHPLGELPLVTVYRDDLGDRQRTTEE